MNTNYLLETYNLDKTKYYIDDKGTQHLLIDQKQNVFYCPYCGSRNYIKNGYKKRTINDGTDITAKLIIHLRLQRYKCKKCHLDFFDDNDIALINSSLSKSTITAIMDLLKEPSQTFTSVANTLKLNKATVRNVFLKYFSYSKPENLPEIISLDEKYVSNMEEGKYIFIILDFKKNKLFDIYNSRHKDDVKKYFFKYSDTEREKVKFVTMDLWQPYKDAVSACFPNAKIAVDSFHVIELINRKFNQIRQKVMNKYKDYPNGTDESEYYYLLKHQNHLLLSNYYELNHNYKYNKKFKQRLNSIELLNKILEIDNELKEAYELRALYLDFNTTVKIQEAREYLN